MCSFVKGVTDQLHLSVCLCKNNMTQIKTFVAGAGLAIGFCPFKKVLKKSKVKQKSRKDRSAAAVCRSRPAGGGGGGGV